jgi:hypothetical protein
MMLGHMGLESAQYGSAPALIGNLEPEALAKAVSRRPVSVYSTAERQIPAHRSAEDQIPAVGAVKEGGLADHDGKSSFGAAMNSKGSTFPRQLPPGFAACFRSVTPCVRSFHLVRTHLNWSSNLP